MRRSDELSPLSRDHHQALFAALELKRVADRERAAALLVSFMADHGADHFRVEEEVLLPAWLAGDPGADRSLAERVLAEHLTLRSRARSAAAGALALEELHEAGELLNAHVRFEERILFPAIEAGLDADALGRLGDEIDAAEQGC
jgi:hypothetical protein